MILGYRFDQLFEVNWFTPYLLGYLIARAFAVVLSVHAAIKATVFVSVIVLPLAMRELLRRVGGDPRLSLLGFPLAFGYSFYWGFLNFSLAIAIGIVHVAIGTAVLQRPDRRNVIALTCSSVSLDEPRIDADHLRCSPRDAGAFPLPPVPDHPARAGAGRGWPDRLDHLSAFGRSVRPS